MKWVPTTQQPQHNLLLRQQVYVCENAQSVYTSVKWAAHHRKNTKILHLHVCEQTMHNISAVEHIGAVLSIISKDASHDCNATIWSLRLTQSAVSVVPCIMPPSLVTPRIALPSLETAQCSHPRSHETKAKSQEKTLPSNTVVTPGSSRAAVAQSDKEHHKSNRSMPECEGLTLSWGCSPTLTATVHLQPHHFEQQQ
ncbi:hypothetical protein PR048_011081 [Dryococelus australis]|uniref:Uncharacterized protein n=1 Tax=Dryococelus australis TaxID=614101 RepID=A0ABQ9HKS7_9NEOP|nr:hypothetical protein PR048_011081 [Dryococelus australis]